MKIKKVRNDNESEFRNSRTNDLCGEIGIKHELLAKYTPQSNGLVERKNRTFIDMARSVLSEYNEWCIGAFGQKLSAWHGMQAIGFIIVGYWKNIIWAIGG